MINPPDMLKFLAVAFDQNAVKISPVLRATAEVLASAVYWPGGTPLGTRRCRYCEHTWDSHDADAETHSAFCVISKLEDAINKVAIQSI